MLLIAEPTLGGHDQQPGDGFVECRQRDRRPGLDGASLRLGYRVSDYAARFFRRSRSALAPISSSSNAAEIIVLGSGTATMVSTQL